MTKLLKFLHFIRLTDEQNRLSLTNLAIIATIVNLLYVQQASMNDVAAFLATVVGYQVKRFAKEAPRQDMQHVEELGAAIKALETKIAAATAFRSVPRR